MKVEERKLRFGMVGGDLTSFVGGIHRKAALFDDNCILVAGCFSRNLDKNLKTAGAWDVSEERVYPSFEEMVQKESIRTDGIDFVVVTTPNASHYAIVKSFLEKGISVMCEKPFTNTMEEATELKEIAKRNNCYICLMYTFNGFVTIKKARELVRNGSIGKVRTVFASLLTDFLADNDETNPSFGGWRMDPETAGPTNCVGDICTHIENTVSYVTGLKIKSLNASLDYYYGRKLDNNAEILMQYDSGATGIYWGSQIATGQGHHFFMHIYGSKGALVWDSWDCNNLSVTYLEKPYEKQLLFRDFGDDSAYRFTRLPAGHIEGGYLAFANIYTEFCKALQDKREGGVIDESNYDYPTVDDGVDGVLFTQKCLESHLDGGTRVYY